MTSNFQETAKNQTNPMVTKRTKAAYKYKDTWQLIQEHGANVCPGFQVTDQNEKELHALALYFTQSENFLKLKQLEAPSLTKGILLRGQVGTGKTLAMRLFNNFLSEVNVRGFRILACRHAVREYRQEGDKALERYGRKCYSSDPDQRRPLVICFDDLGVEDTKAKSYGNEPSVMGDILMDRYEAFIRDGMLTHVTTNLTNAQLKETYGLRIYDRMKEMFNVIKMEGKSFRK